MVQAGEDRDVGAIGTAQAVELHRQDRPERLECVEQVLAFEAGVYGDSHPQMPSPIAVGSRSQSGGVSQMNARIAMTQTS